MTYTPSFAKVSLSPEAEKHKSFLKAVKARAKEFHDHYIKYYSKVTDGLSTKIGRQVRGINKRADNDAATGLWKDPALTFMAFDSIMSLETAQKAFEFVSNSFSFGQLGQLGQRNFAPRIQRSSLSENFTTSVEYVNEHLATIFDEHVAEAKFAAESTASSIANKTFVGPLREPMQGLTHNFMTGTISKELFEDQASSTLLKYQGIVYSKTDNAYAISPEKLDKMRRIFEKFTNQTSPKSEPILVFRGVTQVYSPEPAERISARTALQPALIPPAPTI